MTSSCLRASLERYMNLTMANGSSGRSIHIAFFCSQRLTAPSGIKWLDGARLGPVSISVLGLSLTKRACLYKASCKQLLGFHMERECSRSSMCQGSALQHRQRNLISLCKSANRWGAVGRLGQLYPVYADLNGAKVCCLLFVNRL